MDILDLYLQWGVDEPTYVNTTEEQELLNKFVAMYTIAKAAKEHNIFANTENVAKWRKAYYGILNALKKDGSAESDRQSKTLRRMVYEFVESKVDNSIPLPKMTPKYKADLPLITVTEDYLKYNIDTIFTKYLNDRSERSTYVDGTSWYKVWWDNTSCSHNTSGNVKIDVCLADQIVPQPAVTDWRKLQYIFELQQVSIATIYKLYGRLMTPVSTNSSQPANPDKAADLSTLTMITCYYLNEDGIVGRFAWAEHSRQVICNEHDWQIRKLRTCTECGHIQPQGDVCGNCGSKNFKYENAKQEVLEMDLMQLYNPYEVGETDDESKRDEYKAKVFLSKGTEIPFYVVRQLPFVPRPAISTIESLYGISEAFIDLDAQDAIGKMLTKMVDKTLKSGAVVTKKRQNKLDNDDESLKIMDVNTAEEAAMLQVKQLAADTSQDMVSANMLYDCAKAASGITDSFQGKRDTTATSGKAKEFAAMQSAGRIESLRIMKAAAFAGVYELVLKYLLAFSDEPRKFVKVLPDGNVTEEQWNKYMFLEKDKWGQIYYRDDFSFSTDPAATLSTNRVAMWQETQDKFIQGAFGNPQETATLELFWHIMEQHSYPLAKVALAGIRDQQQKLPPEVETMLAQHPEVVQMAMQLLGHMQQGDGQEASQVSGGSTTQVNPFVDARGGARSDSGPEGNGATHAANVERTNERNRAANRSVTTGIGSATTGQTSNPQGGGV